MTFTSTPSFYKPVPLISAAIFGDWGYLDSKSRPTLDVGGLEKNWSASLTRQLLQKLQDENAIDFVWNVGDIGYADDSYGHNGQEFSFDYEKIYDGFMDWIENISSSMPYMVSVGNHESECHSPYCLTHNSFAQQLRNFTAYNARWAMPSAESGGVLSMWHSWDIGSSIHFVSLDTSTDFPDAPEGERGDSKDPMLPAGHFAPEGAYMAWLEADLKAARDRGVTWLIAGGHRPTQDFSASPAVLALFKSYGVDMYFAGHGHSYTRHDASAFGDGTVHIMVGGAGCDEMLFPPDQFAENSSIRSCSAWCGSPQVQNLYSESDPCQFCRGALGQDPVFSSDNMAIGLLRIETNVTDDAVTSSTLTWSLLRSPDGKILDTITLRK